MAGQQVIKTHQPAQQKATTPGATLESPVCAPIHPILSLQRTIGNQAVGRLLQARLSSGQPGHLHEREGDQEADQVMRMPDPSSSEKATIADGAPAFTTEREDAERVEHAHRERTPPVNTDQSGHPLPFLDTIQRSFGRHDISHIRAHLDSAAAAKALAIGAEAFAHGPDVTFSRTPSLHTAAHEAAHVVQQRAGVSLKGGVGASGDEYEAHADRVGDAVVRGESAEALLDSMVGRGGGLHAAVQRKERDAAPPQPQLPMTAPIYARRHLGKIVDALAQHLAAVKLPEPHPRLRWVSPDAAVAALVEEIRTYVNSDTSFGAIKLYELVYPADLWRLVDDGRGVAQDPNKPRTTAIGMIRDGPVGTAEWRPAVGIAIANALDPSIVRSVKRMGMRLRVQLDLPARMKKGGAVDVSAKRPPRTRNAPRVTERMLGPTDLVASHPLDRLVTEIMTTGNLEGSKRASGSKDDTPGKPFASGVARLLDYNWLGQTDPKLWNWIKVTFPAHPTAEDVAHAIYTDSAAPTASRSELAYLIKASPPYFMIPAETARAIPEAWEHAPPELKDPRATRKPETVTDVFGLANSSIADDMALAQAPKQTKVDPDGQHALDRVEIQLRFLQTKLKPWGADEPLAPALGFVARRRREQAHDPRAIDRWSTLAVAQEKVLRTIATELAQILTDLGSRKMTGEDAEGLGPVVEVLKEFAGAAGVSHMLGLVGPELASARRLHALMPLALTEAKVVATRQAVFEQQREQISAGNAPSGAKEIIQSVPDLAARAAALRGAANRGQAIDADAMEQLAVDADLMTLRARLMKLSIVLAAVEKRADEVGLPADKIANGFYTVRGANDVIRKKVGEWQRRAGEIKSEALKVTYAPIPGGTRTIRQRRIDHERRAVDTLNRAMFELDKQVNLGEHLKYAYERIADQQLRDMLVSMALELGITLLTGQVIGAGITFVRGVAMARRVAVAAELVGEARASRAVFAAANVVFQAGGATVVQGAMGRKVGGREFAENLIGNTVTSLALRPFRRLFADSAAIEKEVRAWAKFAKQSQRLATQAVVEVGAGVAGSRVAHAITHGEGLSLPGSDQVAIQGIAFVAGRLVARRVVEINQRIHDAAQRYGTQPFRELKQKTEALTRQVQAAGKDVKPEVAAKLLESQHELLVYERDIYKTVARGGDRGATENAKALGAMGPEFAEVPLRLAKLKSVVGDQVYEGTRQEIDAALRIANASGLRMVGTRDPKTGVWTMKVGDRTIEVHERAPREVNKHVVPRRPAETTVQPVQPPAGVPKPPAPKPVPQTEKPVPKAAAPIGPKAPGGDAAQEHTQVGGPRTRVTGVPIGMPVQAADKHHVGEAWKLYRQLIAADPTREVALLYNHQLEQWAVVQGGPGSVPTLDAIRLLGWKVADTSLARHSHPVGPGGVASEPNLLPSNRRGDLELVRSDAHKGDPLAAAYMSAIDVMIDRGSGPQPDRTFLFYDRKTNMWTVDYPVAGKHGGRARVSFVSMGQYRRWFQGRFHFSPDIPANATNPAAPSRQSPSGPPKKPANEFEENSPTDVDAKPYGASQGPRIAATTVRDLAVDMESLLKVGGTKTIPTAEGMLFRYVQVARQGSNLAVRRLEAVLPPSQRGQGLGTQLVEAFEEAAVSVARANGLKTVTINVGVFTNESWRLRMEARGYVYTPTEGAWIKTIEFQPLPLLQRIGRRLLR